MTKITPADYVAPEATGPLVIDDKKRVEMVAKAKELLVEPMELGDLANALEQYYVFEEGEHYTSAQLKEIVLQVTADLAPEKEVAE